MMRKREQAVITPARINVSFDLFRLIAPANTPAELTPRALDCPISKIAYWCRSTSHEPDFCRVATEKEHVPIFFQKAYLANHEQQETDRLVALACPEFPWKLSAGLQVPLS